MTPHAGWLAFYVNTNTLVSRPGYFLVSNLEILVSPD
jgi:hypothetical protein